MIMNIRNNIKTFRQFKREMLSNLTELFTVKQSYEYLDLIAEQIQHEDKKIIDLIFYCKRLRDNRLVMQYIVVTRSESFYNLIEIPLNEEQLNKSKHIRSIK